MKIVKALTIGDKTVTRCAEFDTFEPSADLLARVVEWMERDEVRVEGRSIQ